MDEVCIGNDIEYAYATAVLQPLYMHACFPAAILLIVSCQLSLMQYAVLLARMIEHVAGNQTVQLGDGVENGKKKKSSTVFLYFLVQKRRCN